MPQQMPHAYRWSNAGKLAGQPGDAGVEIQCSALGQHQDARRRELLRDRCEPEIGGRSHPRSAREVGAAVGADEYGLALLENSQCDTRRAAAAIGSQ
jgi:hypothetical protein